MGFRFRIDEIYEIPPDCHIHHVTILRGLLTEGEIRLGDCVRLAHGSSEWFAVVVGFERQSRSLDGPFRAGSESLCVAIAEPAPPPPK